MNIYLRFRFQWPDQNGPHRWNFSMNNKCAKCFTKWMNGETKTETVLRKNIEKLVMMEKLRRFPVQADITQHSTNYALHFLFQTIENSHLRGITFIVRFVFIIHNNLIYKSYNIEKSVLFRSWISDISIRLRITLIIALAFGCILCDHFFFFFSLLCFASFLCRTISRRTKSVLCKNNYYFLRSLRQYHIFDRCFFLHCNILFSAFFYHSWHCIWHNFSLNC